LLEVALGGRLGNAIETWESRRKIPRLQLTAARLNAIEAVYTPELCKGHVNNHETSVAQRYAQQLAELGL
jgi:hypothetical protein